MKKGDLVKTVDGDKGIIIDLYNNFSGDRVAIIQLDNERRLKAFANDLIPVEDESEELDNPEEPGFMDKKFTITPREFANIVGKVSAKENKGDFKLGLAFSLFGAELGIEMFKKVEND